MTKTERIRLERALQKVQKCNGNCKDCDKMRMYSSTKHWYYAFGCDVLPTDIFGAIADSTRQLRTEAIETLEFELR